MKIVFRIFYILMCLPLVLVLLSLPFFPDAVSSDSISSVVNIGSKYKNLILPFIVITLSGFLLFMVNFAAKKDGGAFNEKAILYIGIGTVVLYNIMTILLLYNTYFPSFGISATASANTNKIVLTAIGVAVIIMAAILPKARSTSSFTYGNSWSMQNDRIWFISQRTGSIVMLIFGIIITFVNLFLIDGMGAFLFTAACLGLMLITVTAITYIIAHMQR